MNGWIVPAVLVLLVVLLLCLRVGVVACYDSSGPWVRLKIGPGQVQVYPMKKDPKKEARKKARAEKKAARKAAKEKKKPPKEPKKRDLGGTLSMLADLLPAVGETAGRFQRKLHLDPVVLDLTWGEEDPADAAIHYGYAWAAAENILAFLEANFIVKNRNIAIYLDYDLPQPRVYLRAGLSITVGQALAIALPMGVKVLKTLAKKRKNTPKTAKPHNTKGETRNGAESQ